MIILEIEGHVVEMQPSLNVWADGISPYLEILIFKLPWDIVE